MITADAAFYRDEPRYGSPMELIGAVRAWARDLPGFEELWLDRNHHGWVHVGFHGADADIPSLQERVAQEFPGEGVVVVEVPYTLEELRAVSDRVIPALLAVDVFPAGGIAPSVSNGHVALHGVTESAETEAVLREFAGEPLCVDSVPASALVPQGEQSTGGDGWRLLGHAAGAGQAYRTGVATTEQQLEALWQESGLEGPVPALDWQREIAVWFGAVYGSSCPVRLDGVVVDGATLHAAIVVPGSGPHTLCTDDANPHAYVVAIDRSGLPNGPFVVQLDAQAPPAGAPEERTVVDVDLSEPGSRASDEQLHPDRQAGPQPGPLVEDGYDGFPLGGSRYVWSARPQCRGVVIGPIDGTLWRLADGEPSWAEADGQEVTLNPLDDGMSMVIVSPTMDYFFVRAPDGICTP